MINLRWAALGPGHWGHPRTQLGRAAPGGVGNGAGWTGNVLQLAVSVGTHGRDAVSPQPAARRDGLLPHRHAIRCGTARKHSTASSPNSNWSGTM